MTTTHTIAVTTTDDPQILAILVKTAEQISFLIEGNVSVHNKNGIHAEFDTEKDAEHWQQTLANERSARGGNGC